jgi:serine/threonine protein kinase
VDTLTHKGAVLGTAYYMSPEQAQSFPDIDGRTDLFSVGAIMYEMLTGEQPHSAPTYEAVLIAICTRDAEDVRAKAPEVPEKLARVIARALRRDREERYQSAGEMLDDLDAALRESRALAAKTRSTGGVWVEAPKSQGSADRFRTLVYAIVAALGGFAVAAYFVARGAAAPSDPLPTPKAAAPPTEPTPQAAPTLAAQPPASVTPVVAPLDSASVSKAPKKTQGGVGAPPLRGQKATPAGSAGVAGGLGLSTREP